VRFRYERTESYLPTPRHRKPRTRTVPETFEYEFNAVEPKDAPVAITARNPCPGLGTGLHRDLGDGRLIVYRWFGGRLWAPARKSMKYSLNGARNAPLTPSMVYLGCYGVNYEGTKAEVERRIKEALDSEWLLVGGRLHAAVGEPRYVVQTFGLGCNHGGTALLADDSYNPNIPASRYFRVDELDKALALHREMALARGDDRSVPAQQFDRFHVWMPEAVRLRPAKEHGDGDPFLNAVERLTRTKCPAAAAFGAMALALKA